MIGGVAGGVAQAYTTVGFCTCMKTVEITKQKMAASGQKAPSVWVSFMDIYRREGIRGINKGVNAVAIRQMTNWGNAFRFQPPCRAGYSQVYEEREWGKAERLLEIYGLGLRWWSLSVESAH